MIMYRKPEIGRLPAARTMTGSSVAGAPATVPRARGDEHQPGDERHATPPPRHAPSLSDEATSVTLVELGRVVRCIT
jgi:hypothetical protein